MNRMHWFIVVVLVLVVENAQASRELEGPNGIIMPNGEIKLPQSSGKHSPLMRQVSGGSKKKMSEAMPAAETEERALSARITGAIRAKEIQTLESYIDGKLPSILHLIAIWREDLDPELILWYLSQSKRPFSLKNVDLKGNNWLHYALAAHNQAALDALFHTAQKATEANNQYQLLEIKKLLLQQNDGQLAPVDMDVPANMRKVFETLKMFASKDYEVDIDDTSCDSDDTDA